MDAQRVLTQILGEGAAGGFAGGLAGGLASGLLTSKAGRKLGKQALRLGGMAAIGGLAYAAWSRYRAEQAGDSPVGTRATPSETSGFLPGGDDPRPPNELALVLVRAMIAAAQADGRLDGAEGRAISSRIEALDLDPADKAELLEQLVGRVDLGELVAAAHSREVAIEIYTASLLAVEVDSPAERAYLQLLAARLDLPEELVQAIHAQVGGETQAPGPQPTPGA
jgi:uncharacterized membrane protein YebE (DUF533 family)